MKAIPDDVEGMFSVSSKLGVDVSTVRGWCRREKGRTALNQYPAYDAHGVLGIGVSLAEARMFQERLKRRTTRSKEGESGITFRCDDLHADLLREIRDDRSKRLGIKIPVAQLMRMLIAEEHRRTVGRTKKADA